MSVLKICKGAIDVNVLFLILEPVTTISSTSSSDTYSLVSDSLSASASATTASSTTSSVASSATLSAKINKGNAKSIVKIKLFVFINIPKYDYKYKDCYICVTFQSIVSEKKPFFTSI